MVMPAVDLTGLRFGYLTVIRREGTNNSKATWRCVCDCGREIVRESQSLRAKDRPNPKHCGCRNGEHITKHGHATGKTRPYRIWLGMRRRCNDPSNKDWHNYGARGIRVCAEWDASFQAFWNDMKVGYADTLELDRINNDGNYEKWNCHWVDDIANASNRRTNRMVDTPKGRMTVTQAAHEFGIKKITLHARLFRHGWEITRALIPPKKRTIF